MPRPAAVVREFLKDMGEADADGKTYCGGEGCKVSYTGIFYMDAVLGRKAEHAVPGDQVGRARGLGLQGLARRREGQGGGSAPVRKDQAPVHSRSAAR